MLHSNSHMGLPQLSIKHIKNFTGYSNYPIKHNLSVIFKFGNGVAYVHVKFVARLNFYMNVISVFLNIVYFR